MSAVGYAVAAWLFVIGVYGIATSRHLVQLCVCLTIVQASTYVLLSVIGYRPQAPAPVLIGVDPETQTVDPIVQALMLTDIVVEATVVALLLALIIQIRRRTGCIDPNELNVMRG